MRRKLVFADLICWISCRVKLKYLCERMSKREVYLDDRLHVFD